MIFPCLNWHRTKGSAHVRGNVGTPGSQVYQGWITCSGGRWRKLWKNFSFLFFLKLWFLLKMVVCWVYLDFILKNFQLILRTVNILCILFNPPMVAPVFPFKTCFEHLYCFFFANIPHWCYSFVHLSFILKAGAAPPSSDALSFPRLWKKSRICTFPFSLH